MQVCSNATVMNHHGSWAGCGSQVANWDSAMVGWPLAMQGDGLFNAPVMNQLKTYDYLTIARGKILDGVRSVSVEHYAQEFPIGLGSLARILTHIMICEWAYVLRLLQHEVPPYEQWPIQDEHPPPFDELERTWTEQAKNTRAALEAVDDWDDKIEYEVAGREDEQFIVTTSPNDLFAQLVLHEVHHRAQVMNILRRLQVAVEDIDYNALMYQRRKL